MSIELKAMLENVLGLLDADTYKQEQALWDELAYRVNVEWRAIADKENQG